MLELLVIYMGKHPSNLKGLFGYNDTFKGPRFWWQLCETSLNGNPSRLGILRFACWIVACKKWPKHILPNGGLMILMVMTVMNYVMVESVKNHQQNKQIQVLLKKMVEMQRLGILPKLLNKTLSSLHSPTPDWGVEVSLLFSHSLALITCGPSSQTRFWMKTDWSLRETCFIQKWCKINSKKTVWYRVTG